MFRAPPFEPVAAVWTRRVLLAGTFFGLLASYRLWLTNRRFPLVPIIEGFPALDPPWDALFFGLLLALLAAALWFHRSAVAPLVEPRSFRALGRYVARFARSAGEIRLVIDPRPGKMTSEDGAALNPAIRR